MEQQPLWVEDIICWLTYSNYAHNRRISPHVTPEQWEKVYGSDSPKLEAAYQRELSREERDRQCAK